jgi:hypothetical protein
MGRPRPFWAGFGLTAVTFTLYQYYWDFKTQDELYKQFELAREGRDQGAVWYMLGFVLPVLRFVYFAHYIGNLRYLRARFGFQRSLSVGGFLGLAVPGSIAFFVAVFIGLGLTLGGIESQGGDLVVTDAKQVELGLAIAAVGFALYVVLYALAYARLQKEVNEVWAAYDARAAALRAGTQAQAAGWLPAMGGAAPPPAATPRPAPGAAGWGAPPSRPPPGR